MKRQRRTVGAIVRIEIGDGCYCYAQILDKGIAYFDLKTKDTLENKELNKLLDCSVLFFGSVYNDVITRGRWLKVGKLPIRDEFTTLPMKFIHDDLKPGSFELYDPNTGEITPSTYDECKSLECAAVWEGSHVEDRLRDHFNGTTNVWVESLKAENQKSKHLSA
jgi:Immunity protein 26